LESKLSETQKRLLATIFARGAEEASQALSTWLGQSVQVTVSEVDEVELSDATELLGPPEELVAACSLTLSGCLTGQLLLVFADRSGLALADMLLKQPLGTATGWGEMERSAAMETANIVGCAYLKSLVVHLPLAEGTEARSGGAAPVVPSPPTLLHEFAGSLLQFAVMDQATRFDWLLLVKSQFSSDHMELNWSLLLIPSGESLEALSRALGPSKTL
jgi:chemotaxis protein CheC